MLDTERETMLTLQIEKLINSLLRLPNHHKIKEEKVR
jgi:hypothetical protein